jgi:hypothetical protein
VNVWSIRPFERTGFCHARSESHLDSIERTSVVPNDIGAGPWRLAGNQPLQRLAQDGCGALIGLLVVALGSRPDVTTLLIDR